MVSNSGGCEMKMTSFWQTVENRPILVLQKKKSYSPDKPFSCLRLCNSFCTLPFKNN